MVVRPRQPRHAPQVDRGDLPRFPHLRQPALSRDQVPARARKLLRRHPDHGHVPRPLGQPIGKVAPLVLVHADHGPVRPTHCEEPRLGGEIAAHPAMPVEVIGRKVGEDRHIRRERTRKVDLVGRKLQHHDTPLLGWVDVEHTPPDVAGQLHGLARDRQDMGDQRRGGGFPVRAGDRHDLGRLLHLVPALQAQRAEEEADVIVDRHPRRPGRGNGAVRRGVEMWDAGRHDQRRHPLEGTRRGRIPDREPLCLGRLAPARAIVPAERLGAPCLQRARGGQP